eukprot:753915-Hanusia_phi.AAC.9
MATVRLQAASWGKTAGTKAERLREEGMKLCASRGRRKLGCWAGRSQLIGLIAWNCGVLSGVGAFRVPTTCLVSLSKTARRCRPFSSLTSARESFMSMSIEQTELEGFYWQGGDTMKVPRVLHAENRRKVLESMRKQGVGEGMIVVEGGKDLNRADTDHTLLFRQESNFHYLFGAGFPDCLGAIEVSSGRSILFVPRQPDSYSVWMGSPPSLEDLKTIYCVDEVLYTSELPSYIASKKPSTIYTYGGQNSDSGNLGQAASFKGIGTMLDMLKALIRF